MTCSGLPKTKYKRLNMLFIDQTNSTNLPRPHTSSGGGKGGGAAEDQDRPGPEAKKGKVQHISWEKEGTQITRAVTHTHENTHQQRSLSRTHWHSARGLLTEAEDVCVWVQKFDTLTNGYHGCHLAVSVSDILHFLPFKVYNFMLIIVFKILTEA